MQGKDENNIFDNFNLSITSILGSFTNEVDDIKKSFADIFKSTSEDDSFATGNIASDIVTIIEQFKTHSSKSTSILNSISETLTNISENLNDMKTSVSKWSENFFQNMSNKIDITIEFTKGKLSDLKDAITPGFIESFTKFIDQLIRVDKLDKESFNKIIDFIEKMSESTKENRGKKIELSPIGQLALGIGVLTLSLIGLSFVNFFDLIKFTTFIGLLGITLLMFKFDDRSKSPLTQFAFGIGILTLSMIAMSFVTWTSLFKMITFIGLLGLTMRLFNFHKTGPKSPMIGFATGLGIMTLSLFAMSEVHWESVLKFGLFVLLLGLALHAYPGKTPGWEIAKFAGGLGLMVLALYAMQEAVEWQTMLSTLLFVGGLGLIMKFLFNEKSAIAFAVVSGGMLLIAGALAVVSSVDLTLEKALIFGGSVLFIAGVMALLGIPAVAPFILLGAVAASGMAIASILTGVALMTLSAMSYDETAIDNFVSGVSSLAWGMMKIIPSATLGIVGAVLLLPIVITTLLAATTLALISTIDIDTGNIEKYNSGVEMLISSINEFGIISLGKASTKALLLLPMFASLLGGAVLLKAISELDVPEGKIQSFANLMNMFVTSMTDTISGNVENLQKVEPGLDSLGKMINVGSNLADIVSAFANMTYNVYEVKDGKLVLKSVKKITPEEISMVGINVGKLIQGLLKPLAIISGDEDTWDFGGGVKVKNPFKGGWFGDNDSGIERLTKIGSAFIPLTEAMKNLSNVSVDDKGANLAVQNLVGVINQFESLAEKDLDFDKVTNPLSGFLDSISDTEKWKTINDNLDRMAKNYQKIVSNINKLNIDKALALEKNLKILASKEANKNIEVLIEKLMEMIGLLKDKSTGSFSGSTNSSSITTNNNTTINNQTKIKQFNDDIKEILGNIDEGIGDVVAKLSGKLKTIQIETNKNIL